MKKYKTLITILKDSDLRSLILVKYTFEYCILDSEYFDEVGIMMVYSELLYREVD